jgi:acetylornithine/N-succinyldiaminopimelate aminotransferase
VIEDVRGKGLLIGVKMIPNNREMMALAREHGLLIAGGGDNCVRLLPPLNLTPGGGARGHRALRAHLRSARTRAKAA